MVIKTKMENKFPTKKQTSQSQRMSQTILSPKVSKLSSFFKSWCSIFVEDDSNVFSKQYDKTLFIS